LGGAKEKKKLSKFFQNIFKQRRYKRKIESFVNKRTKEDLRIGRERQEEGKVAQRKGLL